jgi:hypothetical protein
MTYEPIKRVWDFSRLLVLSTVLGAGIATIQAFFAFAEMDGLPFWMFEAFILGLVAGPVAGVVIHYLVFRGRTTFQAVATIVALTVLAGSASGLALNLITHGEGGWLSLFVTVPVCGIAAIVCHRASAEEHDAERPSNR